MQLIRRPPSRETLLSLVADGEGLHTEFKRRVHSPEKIAKPISAFANTRGGTMLIGVEDNGRIIGIDSEKEALEIVHEALTRHIDPVPDASAWIGEHRRRMVLGVEIEESRGKPHYHIGEVRDPDTGRKRKEKRVYVRNGSHSKAVSEDTIRLMKAEAAPIRLPFGPTEAMLFGHLKENGGITAKEFGYLAGIPLTRARSILTALVRAGSLLLLSDRPEACYALPAS